MDSTKSSTLLKINNQNQFKSDLTTQSLQKKHDCSIICPSYEYLSTLSVNTDIICTVPNCDEIFSNSSALNLHLEKVHRLNQKVKIDAILTTKARTKSQKLADNCECKYYCPLETCKFYYGNKLNKYLPSFHSLKVHFLRIHGNKSYKCSKCEKSFSIKSERERHETNCCRLYICSTCKIHYSTNQALIKHCKKKGHEINKPNDLNRKNSNKQTNNQFNLARSNSNSIIQQDFQINPCQVYLIKDASSNNILLVPALYSNSPTMLDNEKKEEIFSKPYQVNDENNNNNNNNNLNDQQQRSFGCQTNLNTFTSTQETGSQTLGSQQPSASLATTINLNDFEQNSTQLILNNSSGFNYSTTSSTSPLNFDILNAAQSSTRETQTYTFQANYDYLDATTSTSPINYLDSIFDPLNDKFTQTSSCLNFDQNNDLNKSIGTSTSTNTTQLDECIYSQEFLFDNNLYSNNSNQSLKLNSSQNGFRSLAYSNNANPNRCTTPNVQTNSFSCQTENDLYQENINTIDTITQTDWDFSKN